MNPTTINLDTNVSLSVLVATFPMLVTAVLVWLRLGAIRRHIKNGWTITHQRVWTELLVSHNQKTELEVPTVDQVLKIVNDQG